MIQFIDYKRNQQKYGYRCHKLTSIAILILLAFIVFLLESSEFWFGDNIVYGHYPYMYSHIVPLMEHKPVTSFWDVIYAGNDNYILQTGRYVAHFFVILFCGLLGNPAFAVCNALVWPLFIVLFMRVCGKKLTDLPALCLAVALSLYILALMPSGPAVQINYVWMFTLTLGWVLLFRRMRDTTGIFPLIMLSLLSLIAGNGQEAVNIGVCGALFIMLVKKRFRFTTAEWVMAISFGIGCLADCLAPGTLSRSGSAGGGSLPFRLLQYLVIARAYFSIPLTFLLIVTLVSKGFNRRQFNDNFFLWSALATVVCFLFVIGSRSWNQYFGMILFIMLLTLRMLPKGLIRNVISVVIILYTLQPLYNKYIGQSRHKEYLTEIENQYLSSPDGLIYVDASNPMSQDLFTHHKDCFVLKNGLKKPITVLPSELADIAPDSVPNFVRMYTPSRFLIVQSKEKPAVFMYDLSFRAMGYVRTLRHSSIEISEPLYETDNYKVMIENGYPFLHHEIEMIDDKSED
ncbi:MAG: DUF6056 family protein [Pseudoflavonifractor sp.]|nr:DUF6056 family protein [Pseudoflavonifractor sp.]